MESTGMTSGGSADEEPPLLISPSADHVEARRDANESPQQLPASAVRQQPQAQQNGTDNNRCDDVSMRQQQQQSVVYHHTRGASIQTRHLVVYNTGPAVGVDELTLRRVFEAYGTVERVLCVNPAAARVLVTFHEVWRLVYFRTEYRCTRYSRSQQYERVQKYPPTTMIDLASLMDRGDGLAAFWCLRDSQQSADRSIDLLGFPSY